MPTVPAMQKGDTITKAVLDEVLAMINERRTAVGLITKYWSDLYGGGNPEAPRGQGIRGEIPQDPIQFLRGALEDAIPFFLNTAVHPAGDITGTVESGQTVWSKTTVLQAAGVGGLDAFSVWNWTNVPPDGHAQDLADFSSDLYGVALIKGPFWYKVWINEIILVARKLSHLVRFPTSVSASGKTTIAPGGTSSPFCSNNVGCVAGNHPLTPYGADGFIAERFIDVDTTCAYTDSTLAIGGFAIHVFTTGSFNLFIDGPRLVNRRGKLQYDLTVFPGATLKVFLHLNLPGSTLTFGQNPPVATQGSFQEWIAHGMISGGLATSNYLGNIDAAFVAGADLCPSGPLDPNAYNGWNLLDRRIVIAPAWQYA